jgi:hypothetical protein
MSNREFVKTLNMMSCDGILFTSGIATTKDFASASSKALLFPLSGARGFEVIFRHYQTLAVILDRWGFSFPSSAAEDHINVSPARSNPDASAYADSSCNCEQSMM